MQAMRIFLFILLMTVSAIAKENLQVIQRKEKLDKSFCLSFKAAQKATIRLLGQLDALELQLNMNTAALYFRKNGKLTLLKQASIKGDKLRLFCTPGEVALLLNDEQILCQQVTRQTWRILETLAEPSSSFQASYQKIGLLHFTDNFMHGQDEMGEWKAVSGNWSVHALNTPVRSANPFSFIGSGTNAEAVAGYWFWQNYALTCSVQPLPGGSFGARIMRNDATSYFVYWTPADNGTLTLQKESLPPNNFSKSTSLNLEPTFWYQLSISAINGLVTVSLDGQELLRYTDPAPLRAGAISLWADGKGAIFDDVIVAPVSSISISNALVNTDFFTESRSNKLETHYFKGMELENSILSCTLSDFPAGSTLILRARENEGQSVSIRLENNSSPKLKVCLQRNGQEKCLLDKNVTLEGTPLRLQLTLEDKELFFSCNRKTLAITPMPDSWNGTASISHSPNLNPTNIAWKEILIPPALETGNVVFRYEQSMSDWNDPVREWIAAQGDVHYWNRNDFWGDLSVELQSAPLRRKISRFGIVLGSMTASDAPVTPLATLVFSGKNGTVQFTCGDIKQTKNVGSARQCRFLTLERKSDRILARINGVLEWEAPLPANAGKLMVAGRIGHGDTAAWANAVTLTAPNTLFEQFNQAPADWLPVAGTWEITNRWQCDPRWSFFSGVNQTGVACLWSKYIHGENFTIEYFVGPKMNRAKGGNESKYSADFNLVFDADGSNITSGHSLMFGGWKNRGTQFIYRNKLLNENKSVIIKARNLHHHWFHVKVRKFNSQYTVWIDGKQIINVTDKQTPGGNRFGIWTWQNGIMVAQLRFSTDIPLQKQPMTILNRNPHSPY